MTRAARGADGAPLPADRPHCELRPPDEPPRKPSGYLLVRGPMDAPGVLPAPPALQLAPPAGSTAPPEPSVLLPLPIAAGVPLLLSVDGDCRAPELAPSPDRALGDAATGTARAARDGARSDSCD